LRGPAGAAKTTTIRLLAQALSFGILEWRNPVGIDYSSGKSASAAVQFQDFLGRAGKQGSLDFSESPVQNQSHKNNSISSKDSSSEKIMLVEEFPNTFTQSSSNVQSFRSAILGYLASNTPPSLFSEKIRQTENSPLVLVISESLLSTSSAIADSFTVHRLLGPEILGHMGTTLIEFNKIAPTFLTKALELVIQKEARVSGRRRTLGSVALKQLGEVGDIRNAVGSLEFLCARGDQGVDWSGHVSFGKSKKNSRSSTALTKMEQESLEMITQREATLGIFHAVGKVVYNKREEDNTKDDNSTRMAQPLSHLSHCFRLKRSVVSIDELMDETGTDIDTFIAALHENYLLSCEAFSNEESLDALAGCIDTLSDSDLLQPNGRRIGVGFSSGRNGFQGAPMDNIRQEEMSFQLAVRGIIFALPYPVKRKNLTASSSSSVWSRGTGNKGDAFKMFYPTSLKIWRKVEELQTIIDIWIHKLLRGDNVVLQSSVISSTGKRGVVESWRSQSSIIGHESANHDKDLFLPVVGATSRQEVVLIQLPYLKKILRSQGAHKSATNDLSKVVEFHGIESQSEEVPDDGEEPTGQIEWSTDQATEVGDSVSHKRRARPGRFQHIQGSFDQPNEGSTGPGIEHLTLSDDDIVDD
jgi:cell cycle checkpoint protein